MTKRRFGRRLGFAALMGMTLAMPSAQAQQTQPAEPAAKAGKPINAGDVLSGELNAMKVRGGKKGKSIATFQLTSEPRRLPPPNGLCNLETGPETFQLITTSDAQAAQRSEEHTSELQSHVNLVCRLLLEKKKIE